MLSLVVFSKDAKMSYPLTKRFRVFTGYVCNIRCKFCFYLNKPVHDIKDQIYNQLILGNKFGMTGVDFSGGEPTILPYWFDILKYTKKLGYKDICSITNGYRYSDINFLKRSIDAGLNDILFSLHGHNSEIHDGLTGIKGSFNKILSAINNAKELGQKFRINTVVSKYNYKMIPELANLINDLNPVAMNFLPFRIETNADFDSAVKQSDSLQYIKTSIDILDDNIETTVRYVPFCLMKNYEKYVSTYIQRMFEPYEWSEYLFSKMDCIRDNEFIKTIDLESDKLKLEMIAFRNTMRDICKKIPVCATCSRKWICEGIWKSYLNYFGEDEFKSIEGETIHDPLYFRT